MGNISDMTVVWPFFLPLLGAGVALLLHKSPVWQGRVALTAMAAGLFSSLRLLAKVWSEGSVVVFHVGGWTAPVGINLTADLLSATMVVMSQMVLTAGILYGTGCKDKCAKYPSFFPLFLALGGSLTGAFLTGDLFNLFVFTELLVVSGAALTAMSDDQRGPEAAFKYFYISLMGSLFLLVACGALYASYGTLNMADLARRVAADPARPLLHVAVTSLLAFFMTKSAVMPFHFWQPDFHTAAPTPVHAVLSSVVVKLGVYGFIRMNTLLFPGEAGWVGNLLVAAGVAGVFMGGLGAVGTFDAKRMLAYSTLGQIGFMLAGIGWGTPWSVAAAVVYAFNHSLIKASMLMLAGAVASRAPVKSADFENIQGVGRASPLAGLLFLLGGMSLAGLPPTNGFVSKLALFRSGLDAGSFVSLGALAAGSLLTLLYVARSFQKIWWEPLGEKRTKPEGDKLYAPTILISLCLALGLWGEPLLRLSGDVVERLADRESYIGAVLGVGRDK